MDLTHRILEQYVGMEPHEYVAVALWTIIAMHRSLHGFAEAGATVLRGCGKTLLLSVIERLVRRTRTDSITPAAIYHLIDRALYAASRRGR
jgi:hypothetical protein